MKVSSLYRLYPTRIWVLWHWDTAHPELLLVVWINVPKQGDNTNTLVWGLLRQSNYTYTQRENKIKSSACFFLFLKVTWNLYSDRHTEGRPTLRGWHWGPDAAPAGQGTGTQPRPNCPQPRSAERYRRQRRLFNLKEAIGPRESPTASAASSSGAKHQFGNCQM